VVHAHGCGNFPRQGLRERAAFGTVENAVTVEIYLECAAGPDQQPKRFDLTSFPARIGRQPECTVQLPAGRISRRHAEIRRNARGELEIRDLDSTNGTFVNGRRIETPTALFSGDVIHVGDRELRFVETDTHPAPASDERTQIGLGTLPHAFPVAVREFGEMLEHGLLAACRQPIVDRQGSVVAHELLGRGDHPELDATPRALFELAEALKQAVPLSEAMRRHAFAAAERHDLAEPLFFNIHPDEARDPERLLAGLRSLRETHPGLKLVFEVHEAAVTDLEAMAAIRVELRELDIALAYDDFGEGRARLQELVHVPPDYLKFDIALVRGVADRSSSGYRFLGTLNGMIRDLGVRTLAEGIEDAETAEACIELGIDLLQGYHYGRPQWLD
jgi:EAL domain-containing protein (putative c-di-GMP-specific phosphodiesterase class I)